jgi:hypothetical protein
MQIALSILIYFQLSDFGSFVVPREVKNAFLEMVGNAATPSISFGFLPSYILSLLKSDR